MSITANTPLERFYLDYYELANLRIRSDSTRRHYRVTVSNFRDFLGREPLLSDLTDANGVRFARWLEDVKGIASHTVNQRLNYFRAIWRWCAKENFVAKWPTFGNIPASKPVPRAWTVDQIERLFKACRETPGFVGCIPAGDWWLNLHRFAWETGERVGAIFESRWEETDPDRCLVEIPAKYRKGRQKGKVYFISEKLMADLVAMRPGDEPRIIPCPLNAATFYNRLKRILERAGLPSDYRSKMHRMRRSFASHFEAAGGNATDALSHSSRNTTRDSYLDESIIQRTPSYKILPELNGSEGGES